jgi:hypothetical protein
MTRLEKHKQKLFYKKVAIMVGLLVFITLFLFFVGFQFILKSSGFVSNLKNTDKTETVTEDFFGNLAVDAVMSATNSADLVVSGSSSNFNKVEFYINDKKVKTIDAKDTFSETIGKLQKGKNEIYIKAVTNNNKHSKSSDTYLVNYKNEKPKLDISEPSDNLKTDKSEIKISGKTDPDVAIKVNGSPVVVDSQGGFQQSMLLKEGENKFTVLAEDDAGNSEHKDITVIYEK